MIVTCPSCSAHYRMKSDTINPQKGRIVRCSACGNHWRIFPQASDTEKSNSKKSSPNNSKNSGLSWVVLILCFNMIIGGFGYLLRQDIVKLFPQTERFYQIMGIDVTLTGISLIMPYLEKVNHSDGHVSLLIQGSFLNSHNQKTLKIPPLKITLLNNTNIVIANFVKSDFKPDSLLPGGRTDFTYEILNLPKDAVDVRIEFESDDLKQ